MVKCIFRSPGAQLQADSSQEKKKRWYVLQSSLYLLGRNLGLKGCLKVAHNGTYKSWFRRYVHLSLPKMTFSHVLYVVGSEHKNLDLY